MSDFAQGQRWISEMEPELGLGTVLHHSNGRVQVFFPATGGMRLYASAQAPLKRVRFRVGDTITSHENKNYVVTRIEESDDLITYVGDGWSLPESLLSDQISFHTAEDRLLNGQFDDRAAFALRVRTLELQAYRRQSRLVGFLGGRIDLIPHQLYIAHEVSSRQTPRVLLSDEVGLGKTIEACLILHRLLLTGRAERVLIMVPDALVHQWFVELYRRFNLWFHIYDEERSAAIEGEGRDDSEAKVNPFFDDQLVLCSQQFLVNNPRRARQVCEAEWDLLVVDEAHHLEWSKAGASADYMLVEALSRIAKGLLLLTATPEQLGVEGHFARLRLLDPDRYHDFDAFLNEQEDYTQVAREAELLAKDEVDMEEEKRQQALNKLLDVYGPGRVLFRNTRAAIKGFPRRIVHLVPLRAREDHAHWLKRVVHEFEADAGIESPSKWSARKLAKDPRVDWLVDWIKEVQEDKILLICRTKQKALALHEALRIRIKLKAAVFHEDMTLVQRDRNAAWFGEEDGAQILICSEIGSEGRNFQFAHRLVLFDVPHDPELLEQRIGRLDRIGQTRDILIFVPYLAGSPQEVLARWYHEGLNVFEQNLVGSASLLQVFEERVVENARRFMQDPEQAAPRIEMLIEETKTSRDEWVSRLQQGRNRLLEMNSFRPQVAASLIHEIRQEDQARVLEEYMNDLFEQYGVVSDEIAPRTYRIKPGPSSLEAFPALPEGGGSMTFDRQRALVREEIGFLTWDHPLVTGAIDLVLGSEYGNSTFAVIPGHHRSDLWLEVYCVLEALAPLHLHVDRFLAPTPIRVLINRDLADLTDEYAPHMVANQLVLGNPEEWLDEQQGAAQKIQAMLDNAVAKAGQRTEPLIQTALHVMDRILVGEIDRLHTLQKVNSLIRTDEVESLQAQKVALEQAISMARLRVDAVRLIGVRSR